MMKHISEVQKYKISGKWNQDTSVKIEFRPYWYIV